MVTCFSQSGWNWVLDAEVGLDSMLCLRTGLLRGKKERTGYQYAQEVVEPSGTSAAQSTPNFIFVNNCRKVCAMKR